MNEAAQWRDLLHKKDREIEALHRQIDWLTQQLRRLNGRVYGRSSERSAELQEQLCLFEASSHETVRETPSEASVLCRRKKRCGKREAVFSGLPVEQILHELPQEQRRCPQCGGEVALLYDACVNGYYIVPKEKNNCGYCKSFGTVCDDREEVIKLWNSLGDLWIKTETGV